MIVNSFQTESVFQFCTAHGGSLKQQQYRDIMLPILHASFLLVNCRSVWVQCIADGTVQLEKNMQAHHEDIYGELRFGSTHF